MVPFAKGDRAVAASDLSGPFSDADELRHVLSQTCRSAAEGIPGNQTGYVKGEVRLTVHDLGLSVSFKGLDQNPFVGEPSGKAGAGLSTDSQTVHELLSGLIGTPEALSSGRLVATGDTELLSRMILLLPWLIASYPQTLSARGRNDLRQEAVKGPAIREDRARRLRDKAMAEIRKAGV
ncbi:MAG: hypothetical protein J0H98_06700 [Solirubrobacterales bacterium]|nr:hypothetical protein [Solirubrobacterales bacterium]